MKIAIDTSCLLINRHNGLSEFAHNLLLNLHAIQNSSNLVCFSNYFRSFYQRPLDSYPFAEEQQLKLPRRLVSWWWQYEWPKFDFYLGDIDLFHSIHIEVPPLKKKKTILTIHDCRRMAYPELYQPKDVQAYIRRMKKSLKRVDYVTTVSEFTKKEVLQYFSFPPNRIAVIPNGFDRHSTQYKLNEFERHKINAQQRIPETYFIYIGALDPRKNLDRLIRAMAICSSEIKDFPHLVITGISPQEWANSQCARAAKQLKILGKIHILGPVQRKILISLIKSALALCYPSLYEGFGFPPLEAMALGTPVLASRGSAISETVGQAACLVNPLSVESIAQNLKRIFDSSDYRADLVKAGYDNLQRFCWQKTARQYHNLYKKVFSL